MTDRRWILLALVLVVMPLSARSEPHLSGRTGRGDTCMASYLARRLREGPEESLRFAAALTSMKLEQAGPFSGTEQDVQERMKP